eukprot:COSAG01_NODE_5282_length_4358_cov_16.208734_1_plen_253_part_00
MLLSALVLSLLTARVAAAHTPRTAHPPDDLPPWGVALLATVGKMEDKIASLQTTIQDHSARIRELEAGPRQPGHSSTTAAGRRLQPAPNSSKVVHIHSISVYIPEGPGWRTSGNYNGGHRRTQKSASCRTALSARTKAVSDECCNEPTEDCSSGAPAVCNAGCAAVFLPFWADCSSLLPDAAQYQSTVALCQASADADTGGSGMCNPATNPVQLCPDGTACPQCGSHMCTCSGGSDLPTYLIISRDCRKRFF